jgi:hypothetical protein
MKKPTTRQGQIDLILSQLSYEQLQEFVREKALHDNDFHETLLICFSDLLSSNESVEPKYKQLIIGMIERYAGREHFINAGSAEALNGVIHKLLLAGRKATTPPREASELCLAVISCLPIMADQMEDPDEHVHSLMRTAVTTLWESASALTPEQQQHLFDRVLSEYANPIYLDLDLDSALLSLLKDWAKHKPQRQAACLHQLESILKQTQGDRWRKNYLLEQTKALISHWKR